MAVDRNRRLTDEEMTKHLNQLCSNLFENLELYLHMLTDDVGDRYRLSEMVILNAVGKHVAIVEQQMDWKQKFPDFETFQNDHLQYIQDRIEVVVNFSREQMKLDKRKR